MALFYTKNNIYRNIAVQGALERRDFACSGIFPHVAGDDVRMKRAQIESLKMDRENLELKRQIRRPNIFEESAYVPNPNLIKLQQDVERLKRRATPLLQKIPGRENIPLSTGSKLLQEQLDEVRGKATPLLANIKAGRILADERRILINRRGRLGSSAQDRKERERLREALMSKY